MMRMKLNFVGKFNFRKMDIVSFETAKRLKEAGFPQPDSGFPLVWYATSDFLGADEKLHETFGTVISMLGYMAMRYVVPLAFNESVEIGNGKYKEFFYAPSTADILKQLPDGIALYRVNSDMFYCGKTAPLPGFMPCLCSAAESAAHYWLGMYGNETEFKMNVTGKLND